MKQYKFKDEVVQEEEWTWVATYKDSTTLHQYNKETEQFHQFSEIIQEELKVFTVYNTQSEDKAQYEINIEEGMTPIFFYRITVLYSKTPYEKRFRQPVFGYKENISGESVKTLMLIKPNGTISIRNDDT